MLILRDGPETRVELATINQVKNISITKYQYYKNISITKNNARRIEEVDKDIAIFLIKENEKTEIYY